jgi:putative endonuclease
MAFFVYILECSDLSLYTGSTHNIQKRLNQHNKSKSGAHYTKIRRPVVLKYFEKCKTLRQARSREAEVKKLTRAKKIALIGSIKP